MLFCPNFSRSQLRSFPPPFVCLVSGVPLESRQRARGVSHVLQQPRGTSKNLSYPRACSLGNDTSKALSTWANVLQSQLSSGDKCPSTATRASKEYSKNSNFEYETVTPCILEFEYWPASVNRMKKLQFYLAKYLYAIRKVANFSSLHCQTQIRPCLLQNKESYMFCLISRPNVDGN